MVFDHLFRMHMCFVASNFDDYLISAQLIGGYLNDIILNPFYFIEQIINSRWI